MYKTMEENVRRVRELLKAHTANAAETTSESAHGLVTLTLDDPVQVTSVKLHDKTLDDAQCGMLENFILLEIFSFGLTTAANIFECTARVEIPASLHEGL
ncbi:MAG: hypothetical protein JSS38_16220 [Nitrospira sp.]|nr:hypothetical protein [Nitrospira sp.]